MTVGNLTHSVHKGLTGENKMGAFDEVYQRSIKQPEVFWAEAAEGVDWIKPYEQVLDASNPPMYRWFPAVN